MNIERYDKV
jgi:hypothetical protein